MLKTNQPLRKQAQKTYAAKIKQEQEEKKSKNEILAPGEESKMKIDFDRLNLRNVTQRQLQDHARSLVIILEREKAEEEKKMRKIEHLEMMKSQNKFEEPAILKKEIEEMKKQLHEKVKKSNGMKSELERQKMILSVKTVPKKIW